MTAKIIQFHNPQSIEKHSSQSIEKKSLFNQIVSENLQSKPKEVEKVATQIGADKSSELPAPIPQATFTVREKINGLPDFISIGINCIPLPPRWR
jgi:hypothetical protein